jgi:membrane protease YdiL (CAAX protease family)
VELDATAVVLSSSDDARRATTTYVQRFPRSAAALLDGSAASPAVIVRVTPAQRARAYDNRPIWPALAAFYALTLAISWGWMLPFIAAGSVVHRGSGWPTHVPALLGPMIAAISVTAWTKGATGLRDLGKRMGHWRVGVRWWLWGLGSPLAYFAAGVAVVRLSEGGWPSLAGLDSYSGIPAIGVIGVWLTAILTNGFGEETGWRGFALPQLQCRYTPLAASLALVPMWALWHGPYFAVLSTYRGFAPFQYAGFVFGLACGSVVLTWLYNNSGGSILIVAVWHGTFNMFGGATDATQGTIAAVVSTAIMIQALALVALEIRARHRGAATILDQPAPLSASGS